MIKIFLLAFFSAALLSAADIHIDVKDYKDLPTGKTDVDAIVMDPKGTVLEKKASFDPATGILGIPDYEGVDQASVFIPDLGARYLWNKGYWVNPQGSYWNGKAYVTLTEPGWRTSWHHYWHDYWPHHWSHYWEGHRHDPNWRWSKDQHWHNHWHSHSRWHNHREEGSHHSHHDRSHHSSDSHHHSHSHHHSQHHGEKHKK